MINRIQRGSQTRTFRRPSFSSNRTPFRGGRNAPIRGRINKGGSKYIDPNKFINKAVITETAEHFIHEHKFADFIIDERLKKNIINKGYITPTPIQDKAIPYVLIGKDVVGIANTGTGKTAAFLIPLIHKVLTNEKENILIVVPTRELALQIEEELR